jgi:hypothetical protein
MNIRPKLGDACLEAATKAAGDALTRAEIDAAWTKLNAHRAKLSAAGATDVQGKVRSFAEREAERTKIAAALSRRHAALNIMVRDRLDRLVVGLTKEGRLTPAQALRAILEGTSTGVEGGRNSVYATTLSHEARYIGALMSEIQRDRPHLINTLWDERLDIDTTLEMAEIKPDGRPGVTGNKDAQYLAATFAKYAELARTDLNRMGASIGKLLGWAGAQTHDNIKMIARGKDAWVDAIFPRLDVARTFPDAENQADIEEMLRGIYNTIITGVSEKPTAREKGQRVNPANMAKQLGKSRVLHFESAQKALDYRAEFGNGNTLSGLLGHLRNSARIAGAMTVLGPNPETMMGSMIDAAKRRIKNSSDSDAVKSKQLTELAATEGQLKQALDIATGLASRPVNVTVATIGQSIRNVQSMAKLGGAMFSSLGGDQITAAAAAQFRGSGFWDGLVNQLDGLRRGRPKGEFAELSFLLGEGFDGLIGQIVSAQASIDGVPGMLAGLHEKFFKFNGLSWVTDIARASAGRMIAAEMAMRAKTEWDALPRNYRHVLTMHSINKEMWDAIRQVDGRVVEGKSYITPDRIRDLPDEALIPIVQERVDLAKTPEARAKVIEGARRELELSLLRFVADETSYGVVEMDARARRTTTGAHRPGTRAGEAMRFIMQFKGFPTAFLQRVGGRAIYGHHKDASMLERGAHIGTLLVGMTMAGYMAMTMKDMARGYWPPRKLNAQTLGAAFIQGGAAGIYGDFLFSKVNRFGGGILETVLGPTASAAEDLWQIFANARDAGLSSDEEIRLSRMLTFATQNTPYMNLFYVRPAVDYLFLNAMREVATPGYLRGVEKRRMEDYGQSNALQGLIGRGLGTGG